MSTDFFPGVVEGIIDFTNGGGGNGQVNYGSLIIDQVTLTPTANINVDSSGVVKVNYTETSIEVGWPSTGFSQGYITADRITKGRATVPANSTAASKQLQIIEQSTSPTVNVNLNNCQVIGSNIIASISSTHIGAGITRRTSSNLTASGSVVTAPSGYYANNATKAISGGTAQTPTTTITIPTGQTNITVNTSTGNITITGSTVANITPTVSAGYISTGTSGAVTASIAQKTISQASGSISITNPTVNLTPTISVNSNSGVITVSGNTTATNTAAVTKNGFVNSSNNVNGTITAQIPSGITSALPTYSPSGDLTPSTQRTLVIPKGTYTTGSVYMAASTSGTPEYEGSIPELYAIGGSSTVYETNQKKLTQNITATAIATYSKPASTHVYGTTATNLPTAGKYITNNINVEALTATVTATCTNSAADWKSPTFEIVTVSAQSKFAINLIHDVNVQANVSTNAGISSSVSTKFTGFTSPSDLVIESIHVKPAATYTPSSVAQTIYSKNDFINGNIVIAGDSNFISDNIANGVTIWGLQGTHKGEGQIIFASATCARTASSSGSLVWGTFSSEYNITSINDIEGISVMIDSTSNSGSLPNPRVYSLFGSRDTTGVFSQIRAVGLVASGQARFAVRDLNIEDIINITSDSNGTQITIDLTNSGDQDITTFFENTTYRMTVIKYGEADMYTASDFDTDWPE